MKKNLFAFFVAVLVLLSVKSSAQTVSPADTAYKLMIPNAITPNSETNDHWFIRYEGPVLDSFEVRVFDRWGSEIYSTRNPRFSWNGTDAKGEPLPEGTYYYLLRIYPRGTRGKTQNGFVSLVR